MARTEVFLSNGAEPPAWEDLSLPRGYLGKTPEDAISPHSPPSKLLIQELGIAKAQENTTMLLSSHILLDPEPDQGVFEGRGGIGETHMNKSTYDFIKENCLWSFDGLSRYSKAVLDGKKPKLVFPTESIEVKAVWVKFTPQDLASGLDKKYYSGEANGEKYGLTSLHILTKDLPNWFWATFHYIDAPKNEFEMTDTFGRPAVLNGTVWQNYVLGGTQVDFITPVGEPTIVSDYYIEYQFWKSSCMTCHANAHGHPEPKRSSDGKLQRDNRGRIVSSLEGPLQTTEVGTPQPEPFGRNNKPYFMQTDFLWSIPFRAREESSPPPARCNF
ncbi:MAG: hypothetical protein JSR89_06040 [Proteobacteria bacterium]|nr:hypothetical protein [Pseudomonadota bacterium]